MILHVFLSAPSSRMPIKIHLDYPNAHVFSPFHGMQILQVVRSTVLIYPTPKMRPQGQTTNANVLKDISGAQLGGIVRRITQPF